MTDFRLDRLRQWLDRGERLATSESAEVLPYFRGWVGNVEDTLALFPGWRPWARWWRCAPAHVRTIRHLEDGDREGMRQVIRDDLATLGHVYDLLADGAGPPAAEDLAMPACSVFLSYTWGDQELADDVAHKLNWFLFAVWRDSETLRIGDSLTRAIDAGMRGSRHGVLSLTPRFAGRPWPELELAALRALAGAGKGRRIFPVVYGVERPEKILGDTPWIELRAERRRLSSVDIERVVRRISLDLAPD